MSAETSQVAGFAYRGAALEIEASEAALLDGIRFLYRAFDAPRTRPRWRYYVAAKDGRVHVTLGDELIHVADDAIDAVGTLDWCVSSHLLGDLVPPPVVLHAAGIVRPQGGTVLLVAPSGGGKSTLAAALLARGASLLSDEFVPIEPESLRPLAYPRAIGLKDAAAPPGVATAEHVTSSDHTSVCWLQPRLVLPPGQRGDGIVAVVFCRHVPDAGTTLVPLSRAASLARLMGHAPLLAEHRAAGFATLGDLCDHAPAFALDHADADAAAERLLSLQAAPRQREAS